MIKLVNIRLEAETWKALKVKSAQEGRPMKAALEEIITKYCGQDNSTTTAGG